MNLRVCLLTCDLEFIPFMRNGDARYTRNTVFDIRTGPYKISNSCFKKLQRMKSFGRMFSNINLTLQCS